MNEPKKFVKSGNTGVPVARSQVELERVLRRYGCTGLAISNDYTEMRCSVTIRVPDGPEKDAAQIPVKLLVDFRAVYDALYGQPMTWGKKPDGQQGRVHDPKGYKENFIQQAERVARRTAPVGHVHWLAGVGAKPMWSDADMQAFPDLEGGRSGAASGEPEFDDTVLHLSTFCREDS